jgi:hypothetical protein
MVKKLVEVVDEPVMAPYGDADRALDATTLETLKAEEQVEMFVPGNLALSGVVEVIVNGTRFSYRQNQTHSMPASVAELVRVRIERAALSNA